MRELDDNLTEDDLDNMIDEIDTDGSGTVDWEGKYHAENLCSFIETFLEFKAVMIGWMAKPVSPGQHFFLTKYVCSWIKFS